jgi:hypothetical protein
MFSRQPQGNPNFQTRQYCDGCFSVQTAICPHYFVRLGEPVRGAFPVWPEEDPEI